jgi:Domain of unknown function (DUF5915)
MLRKEAGLAVADRIRLSVAADADQRAVLEEHEVYIRGETLAVALVFDDPRDGSTVREVKLQGRVATVALSRAELTGVAQAPRLGDCLSAPTAVHLHSTDELMLLGVRGVPVENAFGGPICFAN